MSAISRVPYLLKKAAEDLNIDPGRSYMVGDVGRFRYVSGRRRLRDGDQLDSIDTPGHDVQPDYVANDVLDAARFITDQAPPVETAKRDLK